MDTVTRASPRQLARMAGALYLINIVGGAFAIGFVNGTLYAPDPATTAANIQAHQLLYRSGLAAHVVVTVTNVPLALIFYELFKVVNRRVALLTAFFILVATAIEAAGLLNQFAPLVLLGNGGDTGALPPAQLQALISLSGDLSGVHYTLYTVFFGLDILCLSYLVYKSGFLPRAIAILLAVDGLAYLIYSFTDFLAPQLGRPPDPLESVSRAPSRRCFRLVAPGVWRKPRAVDKAFRRGDAYAVRADGGPAMTALLARSSGPADSLTAVPLNVALYGLRLPRSASPVQGQ
jgi:hypothetical protein